MGARMRPCREARMNGGALGASLCRNCWPSILSITKPHIRTEILQMTRVEEPLLWVVRPNVVGGGDTSCSRAATSVPTELGGRDSCRSVYAAAIPLLEPAAAMDTWGIAVLATEAAAVAQLEPITAATGSTRGHGQTWCGQLPALRGRYRRIPERIPHAGGSADGGRGDDDDGDGNAEGSRASCLSPGKALEVDVADREGGRKEQREEQVLPGSAGGDPPPTLGVRAALGMLGFYRGVLSPMMPSTCRFLPTCSVYSIESYKKFGVVRGTVLTAWRLLRCNPWGGRGYDPPAWPPVGLDPIYRYPYTPEVSVALMVVAAYWLVASTLNSLSL